MRRYTESERRQMVRAFEASKQSAAEFCRRRGVSTVSLSQWRRRYAGADTGTGRAPAGSWLPVVLTGAGGPPVPVRNLYVLSMGGRRLEVPSGFAREEVRELWRLLAGASAALSIDCEP